MTEKQIMFGLKNRSAGSVCYSVPDLNVRRNFMPGEVKRVPKEEIERLSYEPGGDIILAEYLQIISPEVREDLGMETEPEYDLTETEIVELIKTGDMDHWEDALNFAPAGVIDLIKTLSVSLPLTDLNKAQMLKDKTGFDVMKAIDLENQVKADMADVETAAKPVRKTSGRASEKPAAAPKATEEAKPVRKSTTKR